MKGGLRRMTKHKTHKRGYKSAKTLKRMDTLREIFKEKTNVFLGLTRDELISEYTNIKLSTILNWNKKKLDKVWDEIRFIKKHLRKERIMAIIYKNMPKGTVLKNEFGQREIKEPKNIFFRCSSEEDAWKYRGILDKISRSVFEAGEQTTEIVEEEVRQKPILQVVNQSARN